jgi:urease accessory protein
MSASESQLESAGWRADLRLRFAARAGRTRLAERAHVGPLMVQRPFYPEGDVCHVYIVHPPGGVVGGDSLSIHADLEPSTHVLITTPAAAKFYRSEGASARQTQTLCVHDAALEWLPQESIYYRSARVRSETLVQLHGGAHFIGWEIACLGLPARAEVFDEGCLRLGFELHVDGIPRWIDRLRIDGDSEARTAGWGLAGFTAIGTMLAYPAKASVLDLVRKIAEPKVEIATTLVDDVLTCRVLAAQGEPIRRALTSIWACIRPEILKRPAISPRIWHT